MGERPPAQQSPHSERSLGLPDCPSLSTLVQAVSQSMCTLLCPLRACMCSILISGNVSELSSEYFSEIPAVRVTFHSSNSYLSLTLYQASFKMLGIKPQQRLRTPGASLRAGTGPGLWPGCEHRSQGGHGETRAALAGEEEPGCHADLSGEQPQSSLTSDLRSPTAPSSALSTPSSVSVPHPPGAHWVLRHV